MKIQDLLAVEMENISRSDEAMLADMSCTLGWCGALIGSCGKTRQRPNPQHLDGRATPCRPQSKHSFKPKGKGEVLQWVVISRDTEGNLYCGC